MIERSIYI